MYEWRKASPDERARMLRERKLKGHPWHSPPHLEGSTSLYHICAACYEHEPYIGTTLDRLQNFSEALLETLGDLAAEIFAWSVLPNHYHAQLRLEGSLKNFIKELGKLHGRTSFKWNGEENCRGRKIWCNAIDRWVRDEGHFWTALNYIHHNTVWCKSGKSGLFRTLGNISTRLGKRRLGKFGLRIRLRSMVTIGLVLTYRNGDWCTTFRLENKWVSTFRL